MLQFNELEDIGLMELPVVIGTYLKIQFLGIVIKPFRVLSRGVLAFYLRSVSNDASRTFKEI